MVFVQKKLRMYWERLLYKYLEAVKLLLFFYNTVYYRPQKGTSIKPIIFSLLIETTDMNVVKILILLLSPKAE